MEVPARQRALAQFLGHPFVEGVAALLGDDLDLTSHGKGHMIGGIAELADVLFRAGFLAPEIVAGDTEDHQALTDLGFVKRFKVAVLRGEAAGARHVDDKHGLTGIVGELEFARLVELGEGKGMGCGHGRRTAVLALKRGGVDPMARAGKGC